MGPLGCSSEGIGTRRHCSSRTLYSAMPLYHRLASNLQIEELRLQAIRWRLDLRGINWAGIHLSLAHFTV